MMKEPGLTPDSWFMTVRSSGVVRQISCMWNLTLLCRTKVPMRKGVGNGANGLIFAHDHQACHSWVPMDHLCGPDVTSCNPVPNYLADWRWEQGTYHGHNFRVSWIFIPPMIRVQNCCQSNAMKQDWSVLMRSAGVKTWMVWTTMTEPLLYVKTIYV